MTGFGWLMIIVAAMLGFGLMALLRGLPHRTLSTLTRVIAALLPAFAWVGFGTLDRCFPIPAGERCYYFGMGMIVFAPIFAAWAIGAIGALTLLRGTR